MHFVIPGLTKPAPYLIRGNPVFFWIPALAGMTLFVAIIVAVDRSEFSICDLQSGLSWFQMVGSFRRVSSFLLASVLL